jgi:hypothetical protein
MTGSPVVSRHQRERAADDRANARDAVGPAHHTPVACSRDAYSQISFAVALDQERAPVAVESAGGVSDFPAAAYVG